MLKKDIEFRQHLVGNPNGELRVAIQAFDRHTGKVVAADTINLVSSPSRRRFAQSLSQLLADADTDTIDNKLLALIPLAEASSTPPAVPPFPVVTPSAEPVSGRELIAGLRKFFSKYIVLPPKVDLAIAAWIMSAWCCDVWDRFPHLLIWSPAKRCGKTHLLSTLAYVCPRPLSAANISAAAIYRLVAEHRPTLLIDEAQQLTRQGDAAVALLELLCAGCEANAKVWRVGGPDRDTVEPFSVYAPKVLAHIGEPDDVLADRAVVIRLERKRPGDTVLPWRSRIVAAEGAILASQLARWSADMAEHLTNLYASLEPFELGNDRAAEMWLPLYAVIHLSDPDIDDELYDAAKRLTPGDTDAEAVGIRLLAALKEIFDKAGSDFMATETILEHLCARIDEPWSCWGRLAKPMTAHALAGQLRKFDIRPKQSSCRTMRGYFRAPLEAAWQRYLPPVAPL